MPGLTVAVWAATLCLFAAMSFTGWLIHRREQTAKYRWAMKELAILTDQFASLTYAMDLANWEIQQFATLVEELNSYA